MFRFLGAGVLTIVTIVLIVVVAAVPLLFVYRSSCPEGDGRSTSYSFVAPWNDPPSRCSNHQRGFEVVRDEVGL